MKIKPGASVQGLKPEILIALIAADRVWRDHGKVLVITSGTDGKHSRTSRHYIGMAADLRTRYFNCTTKKLATKALRDSLGPEYKVVPHSTHLHIQFNGTPK